MKDLRAIELDANEAIRLLKEARDILYAWPKGPILKPKSGTEGLTAKDTKKAWHLVDQSIARIEALLISVSMHPIEVGRLGGNKTAERGPDYFKQIAAMRKTRAGGRPRKQAE
jgi:hypothetical protein